MSGSVMKINGDELWVDAIGDPGDPPILLIGGAGSPTDRWNDDFCHRLSAGRRFVIRYDHRDTGQSTNYPAGAPPHPAADLADDALGVLDALGLRRAHLVGISTGGALAHRIAVDHPDRVRTLVLMSISPAAPVRPRMAEVHAPTLIMHGTAAAWDSVIPAILRHTSGGWAAQADRLASRALAADDPTGWFDELYAAGQAGEVPMPWDRDAPHPMLDQWAQARDPAGGGRRAMVVGCGLGADAEYLADLGYDTTAFDISETAVRLARERHAATAVHYTTGDLLDLPTEWLRAFDLVADIYTVQALPDPPRRTAIANVGRLVAPGGALIVVAARQDQPDTASNGPPWPLTRAEIDAFTTDGLSEVRVEALPDAGHREIGRWRAEFRRPR